jgi:hypothetical protein
MNRRNRTQLALGLLLILLGLGYFADRLFPAVHLVIASFSSWPAILVAIGLLILVVGLFMGIPGMAVPATIIAGIGGIFLYQQRIADYASWAYLWTFIPGFIGIGSGIAGLLGDNRLYNINRGLRLMLLSGILFLVFATFFGGLEIFGYVFPALVIILIGAWMIIRTFQGKHKTEPDKNDSD